MKEISMRASSLPLTAALKVDVQAKKLMSEGRSIINFSVGEPDFPTPQTVCASAHEAIDKGVTKYTHASGTVELKQAVADKYREKYGLDYSLKEIAITTGGKYAVYAAICAIADPGDEIILPAPYWTSYYHIIKLAGAVPVVIETSFDTGFKVTPEMIKAKATQKTKAVIINNPNNPSGAFYREDELIALGKVISELDLYVISDEIYDSFVFTDDKFVSLPSLSEDMRARTVLISGVSKAYAMTGWRIGFAMGNAKIISAISAILSHTTGSPNAISQAAAVTALETVDPAPMCAEFKKRSELLTRGLSGLEGLRFPIPEGAFYLILCPDGKLKEKYPTGTGFSMALLENAGVATVPCEDFGLKCAVRISYSIATVDVIEGIRRIREFIIDQVK